MSKVYIETFENPFIVSDYVRTGWAGIASHVGGGVVEIIPSSSVSWWGKATAMENAREILDDMHSEDTGFANARIKNV